MRFPRAHRTDGRRPRSGTPSGCRGPVCCHGGPGRTIERVTSPSPDPTSEPVPTTADGHVHDVLVVGVGPGAVATPINAATIADPALLKTLNAAIPLGRLAQPEEIATVVAFLAGPGASYLTATTLFADGGIMQSSPGL